MTKFIPLWEQLLVDTYIKIIIADSSYKNDVLYVKHHIMTTVTKARKYT